MQSWREGRRDKGRSAADPMTGRGNRNGTTSPAQPWSPASHDLVQIKALSLALPADTHHRRAMACQHNEICCRPSPPVRPHDHEAFARFDFNVPSLPFLRLPSRRPRRLPPVNRCSGTPAIRENSVAACTAPPREDMLPRRFISLSLELRHSFKPQLPQLPEARGRHHQFIIHR
jgi:hypothetical protein